MKTLLLGSIALAMSVSLAHAAPISFLFDSPTGNLGPTHTYTTGAPPLSVFATGRSGMNFVDLWGKNGGVGEQGLGLVNDPSGAHEITYGSFIQLDVHALFHSIASMSATFAFGSTTGNEEYAVYGSNSDGVLGTLLTTGKNEGAHDLPSFNAYAYYDFTSFKAGGNVLLREISAYEAVPEPASMALVGAGLIGLGYVRRRASRA